jgi:hypothetical protein
MMKKFKTFEFMVRAVPGNYEQLKEDDDFKVLVQQHTHIIGLTGGEYKDIIVGTKRLIDDMELESRGVKKELV